MFLDEVFYAGCFMVSDVVKQQQVLLFLAKFSEQSPKKMFEGHAVLRIVKVVVELVAAGQCAKCCQFFGAPEERSSRRLPSRKPNPFICCL